jgi:hypothetical protein
VSGFVRLGSGIPLRTDGILTGVSFNFQDCLAVVWVNLPAKQLLLLYPACKNPKKRFAYKLKKIKLS